MNIPILIVGLVGTFLTVMFFVIAAIEGFKMAFQVIATSVIIGAATVGMTVFWIWVAGGFA